MGASTSFWTINNAGNPEEHELGTEQEGYLSREKARPTLRDYRRRRRIRRTKKERRRRRAKRRRRGRRRT
jgi:hypothetical protein